MVIDKKLRVIDRVVVRRNGVIYDECCALYSWLGESERRTKMEMSRMERNGQEISLFADTNGTTEPRKKSRKICLCLKRRQHFDLQKTL